jgi:hypothetical protein
MMPAVKRAAVLSDCGVYRYSLTRSWGTGPQLTFVLLNPSTADADVDDQTVRRCVGYASRQGCTSVEIVNLYALRSTNPAALKSHPDPVGPDNDYYLASAVQRSTAGRQSAVVAWSGLAPPSRVATAMAGPLAGAPLRCLGLTTLGRPRHPSRGAYRDLEAWGPRG